MKYALTVGLTVSLHLGLDYIKYYEIIFSEFYPTDHPVSSFYKRMSHFKILQ